MKRLLTLFSKPISHTPPAWVLLVVCLLLFLGSCWVLPFLHADNSGPLQWPGFENCTGNGADFPSPWYQLIDDQGYGGPTGCSTAYVYSGTYSARLSSGGYWGGWARVCQDVFLNVGVLTVTVATFDNCIGCGRWPYLLLTDPGGSGTQYYSSELDRHEVAWGSSVRVIPVGEAKSYALCVHSAWYDKWVDNFELLGSAVEPTPTPTPTSTPSPLPNCVAPPDGGFDAVPITSTWQCFGTLGQIDPTLFVDPNGITGNSLYWLQDMRFNYPVGEGCYKIGSAGTFQITDPGVYTFSLDYVAQEGIPGINALWTTSGLIPNFPGPPNDPTTQFWTGRLVQVDGITTTIYGSQVFTMAGPYSLFFQFIPRRDPFQDGPGTDVIMVDNACIRNVAFTPTPTPTGSPTPTPTRTPTSGPSPTPTNSPTPGPTPTPTAWSGPVTPTPGGPTPTAEPPEEAGFCDRTSAPSFPPDNGSCGPDVVFWLDPIGWVRQQLCKLVELFPRSFKWLGWLLQWLFCPILDVVGWLACTFAIIVPMIGNFLSLVRWVWDFITAAFQAFNFEKNKTVTVFESMTGGWLWIELTDVIAKLKTEMFFGWIYDWFLRALLWWNTFIWILGLFGSGAGEAESESQEGE